MKKLLIHKVVTAFVAIVASVSPSFGASEAVVNMPLIDTNVPLYVLVNLSPLNTNPLGMMLFIR